MKAGYFGSLSFSLVFILSLCCFLYMHHAFIIVQSKNMIPLSHSLAFLPSSLSLSIYGNATFTSLAGPA